MTTTYSTPLRLALQALGDNIDTWGDVLNSGVFELLEQAICEVSQIDLTIGTGPYTLSTADGTVTGDEARSMVLQFEGTPTVNKNIVIPALTKTYVIRNTTNKIVTITTGSGATVAFSQNQTGIVYCDGTEVFLVGNNTRSFWGGTAGGTANALTVTTVPKIGTLSIGDKIGFIAASNNSSIDVTISPDGAGPYAIFLDSTNKPFLNAIVAGKQHEVVWDGTRFQLLNPNLTAVEIAKTIYPVGSIYYNLTDSTNPGTLFGVGTWEALSPGRHVISSGTGTDINDVEKTFTAGETGGEYEHIQTNEELAPHAHGQNTANIAAGGGTPNVGVARGRNGGTLQEPGVFEEGGGEAMPWLSPYIVAYVWVRTA